MPVALVSTTYRAGVAFKRFEVTTARVCIVCHHAACPGCENWCDRLVDDPDDPGERIPCCGMACTYETE